MEDDFTYQHVKTDPTSKYKKQFIAALKDLKDRNIITYELHRKLYPTVDQPPRFYGLPKVHKKDTPLRPIVSSIGTISYECAKYVASVLTPMVGKTKHHVNNSSELVKEVSQLQITPEEELRSYDVTALFTSVPVDSALDIIKEKLEQDTSLSERTPMNPLEVTNLLQLCLKCTYFQFRGEFYVQVHGAAMGSPVSPIVCNLYMEDFEQRAIRTALHPPRWWKRYVDDTYIILDRQYSLEFTDHLNSLDPYIKWTTEGESTKDSERTLPFLDTVSVIQPDGTITTRVFHKETHTDQYLNFQSNSPLEHKRGVVKTLMHRANTIVMDEKVGIEEKEYVKQALWLKYYPEWLLQESDQGPKTSNFRDRKKQTKGRS